MSACESEMSEIIKCVCRWDKWEASLGLSNGLVEQLTLFNGLPSANLLDKLDGSANLLNKHSAADIKYECAPLCLRSA